MTKTRKKQILSLITSMTLLSGVFLPCGTTALAADRQNPVYYGDQAPESAPAATENGSCIENTSVLSSADIAHGKTVKVWFSSQNGTGTVYYDVYYKKATSAKWSKAVENTGAEFVKIKPSVATDYIIRVDAKDNNGNIDTLELPLKVSKPLTNISYLSSEAISFEDSIKVYCRSEGGVGQTEYAVYYKKSSDDSWIRGKNYSTSDMVFIRPKAAAEYSVKVKAKDESGVINEKTLAFKVKSSSNLQNRSELSASSINIGDSVTIRNASAGGDQNGVQFAAYYRKITTENWSKISAYTDDEDIQFTPAKTGEYVIRTKVRDGSGKIINKDIPLTVTTKPAEPAFSAAETDDTIDMIKINSLDDYIAMQREVDPSYEAPSVLPTKVDNSTSEYFPAIVKQEGSTCCIYSTTYYQYTYEYNRIHNIVTNENNCFSPAYTYNLATDVNLHGMSKDHAYTHLKYGAVTSDLVPFGYEPYSQNGKVYFRNLPLNEEIYRSAADHRIRHYYKFKQFGEWEVYEDPKTHEVEIKKQSLVKSVDDEYIIPVKTALADGHVLTFKCYPKWRTRVLQATDDPEINKGVVGQESVYYSFSQESVHVVTAVGYDDNIWTDVNGNGQIDPGEMGALKVADSDGTEKEHHNDGYLWIAYDALNLVSCVKGFELTDEDQAVKNPGKKLWRYNGAFEFCGIQLMPADYKPSVFMHYVANTNDRVNSYAYLTGEYNGKTVTECMDPFNHTVGQFAAVPYNLIYRSEYAHFVYDISTAMRKLGADDYTKVNWTVKLECQGTDDTFMKVSDVYLCDEKNYRIYRTNGTFPINLSANTSRSLTLSEGIKPLMKKGPVGFGKDSVIQERLGVLAATCAARKRLPLRTAAIRRRLLFFIVRLYSR